MFRYLIVVTACVFGGTCSAATLNPLDLLMRLDSTGFTNVSVFDGDLRVSEIDFLNVNDDTFGLPVPHQRFNIGEDVSLTAMFDDSYGQISTCDTASISCSNSFGDMDGNTFSIGDGAGSTLWGDFLMEGGTNVGDRVSLTTFEGIFSSESLGDNDYVTWDAYIQNFTVVANNLVSGDGPTPPSIGGNGLSVVPLPASILFLVASLSVFGLFGRRSTKSA